MTQRTALVTGGAGFIGSQLLRDLRAEGTPVLLLDNFQFGRYEHLDGVDGVTVLPMDIRTVDVTGLRRILEHHGVSRVFHLAALHFIPYCEQNPTETIDTNIEGTRRVLAAVDGSGVESLVFASTGDVYAFSESPMPETHTTAPFNIYGYSKLAGEELVRMAARRSPERRYAVARLFNAVGPRETNPHVIPHILDELRKGDVIHLGNTSPIRDYIATEDISAGLRALSTAGEQLATCNVCRTEGRSVVDVVDALARILSRPLRIEVDQSRVRKVERPTLVGDNRRLRELTGWAPRVDLEEALRRLVAHERLD